MLPSSAPAAVAAVGGTPAAQVARATSSPTGAAFAARLDAHVRAAAPAPAARAPLAASLRAVEAAQGRLDSILAAARSGRTFTAGELLALQAEAYRFTQTLDVAGKLVEHGVQGVKQAIQTPL